MSSPAVPLTQSRSSHASGLQENQRSHPATRVGYSDAAVLAVDRLPQEPHVIRCRDGRGVEPSPVSVGSDPQLSRRWPMSPATGGVAK